MSNKTESNFGVVECPKCLTGVTPNTTCFMCGWTHPTQPPAEPVEGEKDGLDEMIEEVKRKAMVCPTMENEHDHIHPPTERSEI